MTGKQEQGEETPPGLNLTEKEASQVEDRAQPNALVVHEIIRAEGEQDMPPSHGLDVVGAGGQSFDGVLSRGPRLAA